MALIQKTNPKGVDFMIDAMQSRVYDKLIAKGWSNYESYPRAYANVKKGGTVPEFYLGENEYQEVLMNDKFSVTSFFLVDNARSFDKESGQFTQTVSMIFQADIRKLFPTVSHRADEEMHEDIFGSLKLINNKNFLTTLIVGVDDVYSSLSIPAEYIERVQMDDISNYHVCRLDFSIPYNYCNF
jgi:hypothetical protein